MMWNLPVAVISSVSSLFNAMSTSISTLLLTPKTETIQLISLLYNQPHLLPMEDTIRNTRTIIVTVVLLTILQCFITCVHHHYIRRRDKEQIIEPYASSSSECSRSDSSSPMTRNKTSYLTVMTLMNTFIGVYGLYHFTYTIPHININIHTASASTISNVITGYRQCSTLGAIQIGFNIWAITVGVLSVHETPLMLIHHMAVIFLSFFITFSTIGVRYFVPFALGVSELSSVPLSMMNYMKLHYQWSMTHIPKTYQMVRIVFAFMFLLIRVILWTVFNFDSFTYGISMYQACGSTIKFRVLVGICFVLNLFLTVLQYYWGVLIVMALVRMVSKKKKTL